MRELEHKQVETEEDAFIVTGSNRSQDDLRIQSGVADFNHKRNELEEYSACDHNHPLCDSSSEHRRLQFEELLNRESTHHSRTDHDEASS